MIAVHPFQLELFHWTVFQYHKISSLPLSNFCIFHCHKHLMKEDKKPYFFKVVSLFFQEIRKPNQLLPAPENIHRPCMLPNCYFSCLIQFCLHIFNICLFTFLTTRLLKILCHHDFLENGIWILHVHRLSIDVYSVESQLNAYFWFTYQPLRIYFTFALLQIPSSISKPLKGTQPRERHSVFCYNGSHCILSPFQLLYRIQYFALVFSDCYIDH